MPQIVPPWVMLRSRSSMSPASILRRSSLPITHAKGPSKAHATRLRIPRVRINVPRPGSCGDRASVGGDVAEFIKKTLHPSPGAYQLARDTFVSGLDDAPCVPGGWSVGRSNPGGGAERSENAEQEAEHDT